MNYRKMMGVEKLSADAGNGIGVRVAILDSGVPKPTCLPACFAWYPESGGDDEYGHATAVASILFGGGGITGVCEGASPLYFKVLDDSGRGSVKSVVNGIYKAIDYDVDLINLSLGFMRTEECPKALQRACEAACESGKVIFCAAGNDGGAVNWPGALKTTICVGSADKNGLKMPFSSVGEVDFVAPGQNLRVLGSNGGQKTVSGTSFSAALVTGVAALLCRRVKSQSGRVGIERMRSALKGITIDVEAPGYDMETGHGLVFGGKSDPTVDMMPNQGFFGRILGKMKTLFSCGQEGLA